MYKRVTFFQGELITDEKYTELCEFIEANDLVLIVNRCIDGVNLIAFESVVTDGDDDA